ncbi:peptidase inhibitor family I36 protein [Streptomyces sp. NRRL B-1347]|uniref:peptidase inhibitor family I36 protein n=1 Tax=Streptomyces sp. NRRL B-1347 TaxID=1476877 RepID=UPI0004C6F8D1|nr:peptidase inhibitor family I36 protein [Streptomyces sp. NRRL B-1347]
MRKKIGVAAASSALLLGGLATAPASAGDSSGGGSEAAAITCAAGDTCFWVHINYGGNRGRVAGNNGDFRDFPQGQCASGTWNDCVSSIANRGRECTVYFWTGFNYTGRYHSLSRNDEVPNFAAAPPVGYNDPAFNDAISSNHWCSPR